MTHPYLQGTQHPRVLAHRGLADADIWENTAAAFAAAHALGVEYIESDIQVTRDGEAVLFHDDTLERVTGDPRRVGQVTASELGEIFASHGGLLSVAEALYSFPGLRFNLDLKTDAAIPATAKAVAAHTRRVLLTSFSDKRRRRAIAQVQREGASLPPAASGGRATIARALASSRARYGPARALREVDALQIPVSYGRLTVLTSALLSRAHRHGVEVHVWTINDPQQMRELIGFGVDGIVTDRADLAVETLR